MSESLNSFRDRAVEIVDGRYGYTVEHSLDPEAHRAEYEREERRLRAAAERKFFDWYQREGRDLLA